MTRASIPICAGGSKSAWTLKRWIGGGGHLDIFTAVRTTVRENRADETVVRISPQQVAFPVGARLRSPLAAGREWRTFA